MNGPGIFLATGVVFLVLGTALFLIRHAGRLTRIDVPDARRLHQTPTPRGGGLAMPFAVSFAAAVLLLRTAPERRDLLFAVLAYALPNGVLGVVDDYHPLKSRWKFLIQALLAVLFVVLCGRVTSVAVPPIGTLPLGPVSYPFTVLWLVWSTNVYNFMDGLDGLAAGSGLLFFATLAALGWGTPLGWTAIFGAAACAGFLAVNYPPARIFMGDGGALYIGALLGALAVLLPLAPPKGAGVPFAAALLAQGSFLWDATYTILARIARREDWLHPHKRHLFQRLVTRGWSHTSVRRLYAFLGLAGSAAALGLTSTSSVLTGVLLALALLSFAATSWLTERLDPADSTTPPRPDCPGGDGTRPVDPRLRAPLRERSSRPQTPAPPK